MFEKPPQFNNTNEKRPEVSFEDRVEGQVLDYIIQNSGVERLDMESFVDHYGKSTVAEDQAVVEALEKKFKQELDALSPVERAKRELSQKRGEALEIIIADQGELSDWFGPNAMTMRAAKIDDYRHKVDLVMEFDTDEGKKRPTEEDVERVALAIDASDNLTALLDKIKINQEKITGKRPPAHLQYFRSQVTDYEGPLHKIIPVVVGLEGKNMQDLVRLQNQSLRGIDLKATHEQLAKHPAQRMFIEEILAQLAWYMRLLEEGKKVHLTYEKKDIEALMNKMEALLRDKRSISLGEFERDAVMQEIQKIVE